MTTRTAAATAARTRKKHERWAAEMRKHGWTVAEPEKSVLALEVLEHVGTTSPEAIAELLSELGLQKYGAHEMGQIAELLRK